MKVTRLFIVLVVITALINIGLLFAFMLMGRMRPQHEISYVTSITNDQGLLIDTLYLLDVDTGISADLKVFNGAEVRWSPDGTSAYLITLSFDSKSLVLYDVLKAEGFYLNSKGHVIFTSDSMISYEEIPNTNPTWSPDNTRLAFLLKASAPLTSLYLYDPQTDTTQNLTGSIDMAKTQFVWSPDSISIAYTTPKKELWVLTPGEAPHQLPITLLNADQPILWSLDSASLIVKAEGDTTSRTRLNVADGTRTVIPVCDTSPDQKYKSVLAWRPDGLLTCTLRNKETHITDIVLVDLNSGEFTVIAREQAVIGDLSWTEDSRYLVYQADAYVLAFNVMAYDETTQSLSQVTRLEGRKAVWRRK